MGNDSNNTQNKYPLVSIMIATFNSEKLLPMVLDAIRAQTYPQDRIEILCIDGGSTDGTVELCKKYNCVVINNPKTDPVNAKIIGYESAKGDYLLTIDHDEVIFNNHAIENRIKALQENPNCKAALCSGYVRPDGFPYLSQYVSDFGDPFSLFIYGFPKCYPYLERFLIKNFKYEEHDEYYVIDFSSSKKDIIYELACAAGMMDMHYFNKIFERKKTNEKLSGEFYRMLDAGACEVVFMKNEPLYHYSSDKLKRYYPKLKWRIYNNIYITDNSNAGFTGRTVFQPKAAKKKILFVPYTISTIIPFLHGMGLAISRKNPMYLMHVVFCWYVLLQIVWQYTLKITGHTPKPKSYDGKKTIE